MTENERTLSINTSEELARAIVFVLIEKKALDVKLYCVEGENSITDYYVNATGRSSTQVGSLADEILYKIGLMGRDDGRLEGRGGKSWLLVDYGSVIVNVFDRESREFYNTDHLFSKYVEVDISDIISEVDKKFELNTAKEN